MKITVKTPLVEIHVEDEVKLCTSGYTKHDTPELHIAVEAVVTEAIRLHKEIQ